MILLRPIFLYDSETWILRKTEILKLMIFQRKVVRKMYGPVFDSQSNERKKLHIEKLKRLFQKPNTRIVREFANQRLSWTGHVLLCHAWSIKGTLIKRV
jgi:hypothetical protein